MSVDGTDMPIRETMPFNGKWYSHKLNGPAVRYEVGVSSASGEIIWLNGPFLAGTNPDNKIFRETLKGELLPNEMVICENGYADSQELTKEDAAGHTHYHREISARYETVNMRMKLFRVLTSKYATNCRSTGYVSTPLRNLRS